jgi:hypothetical protein
MLALMLALALTRWLPPALARSIAGADAGAGATYR